MQDSKNDTLPSDINTQENNDMSPQDSNIESLRDMESIQEDSFNSQVDSMESNDLNNIDLDTNQNDIDDNAPQDILNDIVLDSKDSTQIIESMPDNIAFNNEVINELESQAQQENTNINEAIESNIINNLNETQSDSNTDLLHEVNVPHDLKEEILESNITQIYKDSHNTQQGIHTEELNKEDLFDNIILQKSHNEIKPKTYKWQYLVYSKRVFIGLVCIAFVVGSYAVYLFFGSTSLEVLWDLHKTRNNLRLEVEQSRLDNATLQRDVLELRALEPK
ncbi:hypothetical protein [Helicobacter bilis]|uniref:Uncharacterized protein n=2 Tax=Helicobacter bilis TaxID=37372 RepID=A0A6D2C5T5_9HELI|nr:hypothetical protein [Helicobacter bilis]EMZ36850.1 hypothetical protein C826_02329 [Helicobacter bilis WiWa]TLE03540.1 hypothetical protein LS77_008890 [Helicobacter bilis]TLE04242.1 hypothetical protein LS76_008850 [Helicobacter bilis]